MSWIERAKVGDKVTLIRPAEQIGGNGDELLPVYGEVYTVRAVLLWQGIVCLHLSEIKNDVRRYRDGEYEGFFSADRFKPVKSTDIQVEALKRICLNTPETVE